MSETKTTRLCACPEHADARTCIELRYFGRSPVMRRGSDHSEAAWLEVDMDQDEECECICHEEEEDYCDDPDEVEAWLR